MSIIVPFKKPSVKAFKAPPSVSEEAKLTQISNAKIQLMASLYSLIATLDQEVTGEALKKGHTMKVRAPNSGKTYEFTVKEVQNG